MGESLYVDCKPGQVLTYSSYNQLLTTGASNYYLSKENQKPMKEGKKELFELVFTETIIRQKTFTVLASNEEEAKKEIQERECCDSKSKTLSEEVVLAKISKVE